MTASPVTCSSTTTKSYLSSFRSKSNRRRPPDPDSDLSAGTRTQQTRGPQETLHAGADQVWWRRRRRTRSESARLVVIYQPHVQAMALGHGNGACRRYESRNHSGRHVPNRHLYSRHSNQSPATVKILITLTPAPSSKSPISGGLPSPPPPESRSPPMT